MRPMKQALKIVLFSALATAALIKAFPASAEQSETVTSVVRTADLDLSSESGQRFLDQRIAIAARLVCAGISPADLKGLNDEPKCRESVRAQVRVRLRQGQAAARPISVVAER